MTPRAAHDALAAFRPLNRREAHTVLDNPGLGWAPGTEDEARALIATENARMGGGTIPHPDRIIENNREPEIPLSLGDDRSGAVFGTVLLAAFATLGLLLFWVTL